MGIAVCIIKDFLLGFFGDGGNVFCFSNRKIKEDPFQQTAAKPFVGVQKHKVVDREDGSVFGQRQYCVVHITRDMKEPFFEAGQKNQVKQDGKNTPAGERHLYLFNNSGSCCVQFFGHNIKYFLNAEKSRVAFAVYEG